MKTHNLFCKFLIVPAMVVALAGSALAATRTWTNNGTTDFNLGTNWTGGLPTTIDNATFTGANGTQPSLSAGITVQGLTFSNAASSGYILSSSNGSLTLTNVGTGASSAINATNTSGTNTISAPIILGGAAASTATFTQAAVGTLNISGNISSTNAIAGLTLANPANAIVTLSGNNTYSGNTTTGAGTLNINSATAISSGRLTVGSNGIIDNSSAAAITLINNNNVTLAGNIVFTGTRDLSFGSGILTGGGAATVKTITTNNAGTLTIGGLDSAAAGGGFTKSGTGTLTVTGAATANVSGNMIISAGTLILGNNSALGTGSMAWGGGTIQASTALTIANAITITSNTAAIGGSNSIEFTGGVSITATPRTFANNMTAGNMTISGGALGLSTSNTTNTLTLSGPGTTIISSAIQNNGPGGTATSGNLIYNGTGSLTLSNANNTYSGTTAQSAGTLNLSGTLSATSSVAISGASTVFNQTSTGSIGGNSTFSVASGTATLGGSNTYTGSTTLTSGTLNVNNANALGSGAGTLILTNGTLDNTSGAAITNAGNNAVTWGINFATFGTSNSTANNSLNLGTGAVTVDGNRSINFAGNGTTLTMGTMSVNVANTRTFTFNGAGNTLVLGGLNINTISSAVNANFQGTADISITGVIANGNASITNGITIQNTGTTTFSGDNTYSGNTTISNGTLVVGSNAPSGASGALGNATSEVVLGAAGGNLDASLLVGGAFTVGRDIRIPTTNTTDAGTRVLTLGGNTAANSVFSGNVTLGATNSAGRGVTLTAATGGQVTFSGRIQDPTGMDATSYTVTKSGAGTLALTGNNTYSGNTSVTAGLLLVNNTSGSGTGTGSVDVTTAGALGGNGTISGATTISGSLRPGNSIGTLIIGSNVTWNGGVDWVFELGTAASTLALANTTPGLSDLLNITGSFVQGTGSSFIFDFSGQGTAGWYKIVDWTVGTTFSAGNFTASNLGGGQSGTFTVDAGTSALYLNVVPEPSTWVLLAFGLTFIVVMRRRRA